MSLFAQLAHEVSNESFNHHTLEDRLRTAFSHNDIEAVSLLIAYGVPGAASRIKSLALELLSLALKSDAAEATMYLLNFLEEIRREKQEEGERLAAAETAAVPKTRDLSWYRQARMAYVEKRESYCGNAPAAPQLLTLARRALDSTPPATRCACALLLAAHRLRKRRPAVGKQLMDPEDKPVLDSEGKEGVAWPSAAADLPAELVALSSSTGRGFGGYDLSNGAERVPIQWVNDVDDERPPPIVFVRQCVDVDVRPDWVGKPAKACSITHRKREFGGNVKWDPCKLPVFSGKPDQLAGECNWACDRDGTCGALCSCRSLQRGAAHRLQVFRHELKGWCLRTLSAISSGDYIMEYVAERVSSRRIDERTMDDVDIEVYLMDLSTPAAAKETHLDALNVRNVAPFAAFACTKRYANMKRKAVATQHWDPRVPHVAFFATRDIEPYEELTYLRAEGMTTNTGNDRNCGCSLPECAKRI